MAQSVACREADREGGLKYAMRLDWTLGIGETKIQHDKIEAQSVRNQKPPHETLRLRSPQ